MTGDLLFVAMEYIKGRTLGQLIPEKRLRLTDALRYAVPAADALVLDLGLAKLIGRAAPQSVAAVAEATRVRILAIVSQDHRPARQLVDVLPQELDRVLARCLSKDPARRFQTMADLKVAPEDLKEESDSGRPALSSRWRRLGRGSCEASVRPAGGACAHNQLPRLADVSQLLSGWQTDRLQLGRERR